jgi:hypothetical protein
MYEHKNQYSIVIKKEKYGSGNSVDTSNLGITEKKNLKTFYKVYLELFNFFICENSESY